MAKTKKEPLIKQHLRLDWSMSDRAIARAVKVSPSTVGRIRKSMKPPQCVQMDTEDTLYDLSNYPFLYAHKTELHNLSLKSKQAMRNVEVLKLMEDRKSLSPRYCQRLLNKAKKNSRRNPDGSIPEVIIKCADLKEGLKFINDEEVDVIIMDPMYGKEAIETTYTHISEVCGRVLKNGGSALIMVGQYNLPAALSALLTDKRLRYHWCLSVVLPRQSPALQWLNVSPHYKLVLHLVKGQTYTGDKYSDLIIAKEADKDRIYEYQQDQQVFDELAKRFIQHNNTTLLDMTMGSATSLIAGLRTGLCSKIIGVDCKKSVVTIAKKRIEDELAHRIDYTAGD